MQFRLSHKWIEQVFKDRGIPSPGLAAIEQAIEQNDDSVRQRLLDSVLIIERATEDSETLEWVLALIRRYKTSTPLVSETPILVKKVTVAKSTSKGPRSPIAVQRGAPDSGDKTCPEIKRNKHHIYGGKAALTIELDTLRQTQEQNVLVYSVLVEAAPALGPRRFDWESKIPFQLMRRELPLLACSLLGLLDGPLEIKNHGPDSNKTLSIVDQHGNLFVKLSQGGRLIAVPVQSCDVHGWLEIVMQAMQLNSPTLGDNMQLAMLERVAAMENKGKGNARN